jgi:uncharacterized protein (DUF3084 family)
MSKLKSYWLYIVAAITGLVSLAIYIFTKRGDKINKLTAEIDLVKTEKQADVLETEIKHLQSNKENIEHEKKELDKTLKVLDTRREEIKEEVNNMKDPNKIVTYWNNN